jgi:hypothetical protein
MVDMATPRDRRRPTSANQEIPSTAGQSDDYNHRP